MSPTLNITGDPAADELLGTEPLALLIGMLLDQQVPMEVAFAGPAKLRDRVGAFDAATIAAFDPEQLEAVFKQPPSIHRFPGSMAGRVQALCAAAGRRLERRRRSDLDQRASPRAPRSSPGSKALPGFGEQKAKIFLALLGKQYGVDAAGWREAAGDYGTDGSHRSVADIVDAASLTKVREFKRAAKAAAKA